MGDGEEATTEKVHRVLICCHPLCPARHEMADAAFHSPNDARTLGVCFPLISAWERTQELDVHIFRLFGQQ